MQPIIAQMQTTRGLLTKLASSLDPADLTRIPAGFANHILWNLGHVRVTLDILCYQFAGIDSGLDPQVLADFRKGSSPAQWTRDYAFEDLRPLLVAQIEQLGADYAAGRFTTYTPYTTSAGVTLASIDDAISFTVFHEGIHLGYILAQRKALASAVV
jgi:hypothetical protein